MRRLRHHLWKCEVSERRLKWEGRELTVVEVGDLAVPLVSSSRCGLSQERFLRVSHPLQTSEKAQVEVGELFDEEKEGRSCSLHHLASFETVRMMSSYSPTSSRHSPKQSTSSQVRLPLFPLISQLSDLLPLSTLSLRGEIWLWAGL
jgi:hypothetical protein